MQAVNVSLDTIQNLQQPQQRPQTQQTERSSSFSFLDMVKADSVQEEPSAPEPDKMNGEAGKSSQMPQENKITEKEITHAGSEKKDSAQDSVKDVSDEKNGGKKELAAADNSIKNGKTQVKSSSLIAQLMHKNQAQQENLPQNMHNAQKTESDVNDAAVAVKTTAKKNQTVELDGKKSKLESQKDAYELLGFSSPDEISVSDMLAASQNTGSEVQDLKKNLETASKEMPDEKIDAHKKSLKIADKATFTVTDLRTSPAVENKEDIKDMAKNDYKTSIHYDGGNDIQLTFDLNQNQVNQNILSSNSQSAGASSSNFQAMLENLVQENAPDFAKAGSIVLKDNNVGNISLVLHPESLGNVKINLELSDKVITGHITVNSKEAMAAFEGSLNNLKSAFSQNGFETASFDLSMAGQNAGGFKNGSQSDSRQMQLLSDRLYGDYTGNVPAAANEAESSYADRGSNYKINIVA